MKRKPQSVIEVEQREREEEFRREAPRFVPYQTSREDKVRMLQGMSN